MYGFKKGTNPFKKNIDLPAGDNDATSAWSINGHVLYECTFWPQTTD